MSSRAGQRVLARDSVSARSSAPGVGLADRRSNASPSDRPYALVSLNALVQEVVYNTDRLALGEMHGYRAMFRLSSGSRLRLVEFVEALCETSWAMSLAVGNANVLEDARDITVDRYSYLPSDDASDANGGGPDCRNYFRLFLLQMERWLREHPEAGPLEEEEAAARLLQRRVIQDFRFACMEAKRRLNPGRTRYAWNVDGGVIHLWLPTSLPGSERRAWLEANVADPDPGRPGEGKRVQGIADSLLGTARHVPLSSLDGMLARSQQACPLRTLTEQEVTAEGLGAAVATEKAANLDLQRPAIRALGADCVEDLVRQVFEDLGDGTYEEKRLAESFGITRSTFSRFAGSRWRGGTTEDVPDLWRNTAQTLANHGPFMAAAREAGVWPRVEAVLTGGCEREQ